MKNSDLLKYARAGAEGRLRELRQEMEAIHRAFPELGGSGRRERGGAAGAKPQGKPGRRKWTAAQRKAAGERMRKYWAARSGKK